ncbi:MAG: response regulator [Candidatus Thiodiazotropha sp. (ex Monitilora ramsayi)]|nr:response regulator [Candidatus Thiodiazotropha sp. (ex Monitilora ramsayi)]
MLVHFSTLLIEPPGIDSELLKLMLAPEKFQVKSAECGTEAWNLIQETEPPDLVVIDIDLPHIGEIRIGGTQLLQLLGKKDGWCDTPKIVLTSAPNASIPKQLPISQIAAIILKPYDPMRLMNEVNDCIARQMDLHVEEINRQHIQLAGLLRELLNSSKNNSAITSFNKQLKHFLSFTESHFAFEENFMCRHNYPDFSMHHQNHNALLMKIKSMIDKVMNDDSSNHLEMLDSLKQELFSDVNDDKSYITFLQDMRMQLMT